MRLNKLLGIWAVPFKEQPLFWIGTFSLLVFLGFPRSAKAETTQVVIDVPIYSQSVSESQVIAEAELLVGQAIAQQFGQNATLEAISVTAIANRNGEIIPLLETSVSRVDWQQQPIVSTWTRYYNASITLVQRHNEQTFTLVARADSAASNSRTSPTSSGSRSISLIDELVDSGRLSGASAQEVLSSID